MRRHHIYALTQTHPSIPRQAARSETQTRMSMRRAQGPVGLALGTGAVILLALLSACTVAPTQDTVRGVMAAEQSQIRTLAPSEPEDEGLAAWMFDDFFARL